MIKTSEKSLVKKRSSFKIVNLFREVGFRMVTSDDSFVIFLVHESTFFKFEKFTLVKICFSLFFQSFIYFSSVYLTGLCFRFWVLLCAWSVASSPLFFHYNICFRYGISTILTKRSIKNVALLLLFKMSRKNPWIFTPLGRVLWISDMQNVTLYRPKMSARQLISKEGSFLFLVSRFIIRPFFFSVCSI